MRRCGLLLTLTMIAASGCSGLRSTQAYPELEESVRAGESVETAKEEQKLLAWADGYGTQSVEAAKIRLSIARHYAQWGLTDRALSIAQETIDRLDPAATNQAIVPALMGLADIQLYTKRWDEAARTTDRVVEICERAPLHVATSEDPYDECHFAGFRIDDHYLDSGDYVKFAKHNLLPERESEAGDRQAGTSMLSVLGRGYARYGAYREATWYFRRCVDENRSLYMGFDAPPAARRVAGTASGDVEVLTLDGAHSFHSQSPRCLEDLIEMRMLVGDEAETAELRRWQRQLWARGPDLEPTLIESMRKADRQWHDGYNTSHDANNLAFYYAGKGRTQDAIRLYRKAIALVDDQRAKEGVFGGIYPTGLVLDELLGLGAACEESGLGAEALAAYSRARELADRELHPLDRCRLDSRAGRARSLASSGRLEDAEAAWREYLATAEQIRATDHPDFAIGLDGLASVAEKRDRREAESLRRRAAEIRKEARRRVDAVRDLPLPFPLRSSPPPAN